MRALIVLGGEAPGKALLESCMRDADLVIAAEDRLRLQFPTAEYAGQIAGYRRAFLKQVVGSFEILSFFSMVFFGFV